MWPNPQFPAELVTFTEEVFNGKLFWAVWKTSGDFSLNGNKNMEIPDNTLHEKKKKKHFPIVSIWFH